MNIFRVGVCQWDDDYRCIIAIFPSLSFVIFLKELPRQTIQELCIHI